MNKLVNIESLTGKRFQQEEAARLGKIQVSLCFDSGNEVDNVQKNIDCYWLQIKIRPSANDPGSLFEITASR